MEHRPHILRPWRPATLCSGGYLGDLVDEDEAHRPVSGVRLRAGPGFLARAWQSPTRRFVDDRRRRHTHWRPALGQEIEAQVPRRTQHVGISTVLRPEPASKLSSGGVFSRAVRHQQVASGPEGSQRGKTLTERTKYRTCRGGDSRRISAANPNPLKIQIDGAW